jgi:predicted DNA-binding protein (MmcQ/YjbR family)
LDLEQFRNYCLSKKGVTEEFPFDNETLVYKVLGKMFALSNVHLFDSVNLKCDPEKAAELRERYEAVQPGYHMNKKHWNTVAMDGTVPDPLIYQWIDHSYDLIVASLPLIKQKKLNSSKVKSKGP